MDIKQAEAVAESILGPDSRAQTDVRLKRAAEGIERSRKQRIAWFALAGFAIGAAIAYVWGVSLLPGFALGGLIGLLVGYVATRRAVA